MPTPEILRRYAELAVQVGVNLQPGQRLLVVAPTEAAPLVRAVSEAAYARGATLVDALFEDAPLARSHVLHAPEEALGAVSQWRIDALMQHAEAGQAILTFTAPDPAGAAATPPVRAARVSAALAARAEEYGKLRSRVRFNWSVLPVATPAWATFLRPDLEASAALDWLWEQLFVLTRLDQEEPLLAWDAHADRLMRRCAQLDALAIEALHFAAPGTDLTVGLPEGHRWFGPRVATALGFSVIPNLPTEEISTLPHRARVEGRVRATKPLIVGGQLIEGLELRFEAGRVVQFSAQRGTEALRGILEADEGASRLGEVALVPQDGLVGRAGRVFYSTLIDENAACHLALGRAYPVTLEGGDAMSLEAFRAHGGNHSRVHVDFMVGSDDLEVSALTRSGARVTLISGGLWVLPALRTQRTFAGW
ncbi:aminopeptidase [Deinobacterium chartae]|uniref:Aminopeptidase n=1 Tax=Deinobacterium chartae TaxID=521158 RepID=A0A841HWQ2_9DEIO|nr:aminopeptidase [Deinobacterium chartae]MBB6097074.1 aminopeptidase [Deinobacterium chartae]